MPTFSMYREDQVKKLLVIFWVNQASNSAYFT